MSLSDFGLNQSNVSLLFILMSLLALLLTVGAVTLYFLKGVALYNMSRKQRIDREWFGFVPVFRDVLLGNVAQGRKRGGIGKNLAVISVLKIIVGAFTAVGYGLAAIRIVFMADTALKNGEADLPKTALAVFSAAFVFLLIFVAVCLVKHIIETVCNYRIYKYYSAKKAALYTIIGFILPFLVPIFLFSVGPKARHLGVRE